MKRSELKPFVALQALLFVLPVGLATVLKVLVLDPHEAERRNWPRLELVELASAEELQRLMASRGLLWPPDDTVPPLSVKAFPPDLGTLDVASKKRLFFKTLMPLVLAENAIIRAQRDRLKRHFAVGVLPAEGDAYRQVLALAKRYEVEGEPNASDFRRRLLRRVDVVPVGLALAQAANESAWGTSRFAREGNNLFGHWTYKPQQGLVPRERVAGANHFVRVFPDVRSSVRAYLYNLNVGAAYRRLRELRAAMRRAGRPLDPMALAGGLLRYSERGQAYVDEIRAMIRSNRLDRLSAVRLAVQ